jgi:hypothetical protein
MKTIFSVLLAASLSISSSLHGPQAAAPAAAPSASSGQSSSSGSSSSSGKHKPIPSFLVIGTVFNENAFSLPGVQVRIRRAGEKKFRWETYTNARGEFAVRVPPGYEYEVITHVKDYEDQNQSVDSKTDVQQRLSIKLEPRGQAKAGAKP